MTFYYLNPAQSSADSFVFESGHLENVPPGWRARITFEFMSEGEFHEHFDLDTAKGSWERYLTTRFLKLPESRP